MGGYISGLSQANDDHEKYMAIIKHLEYRVAVLEGGGKPIPNKKELPRLRPKLQHDIKTFKLKKVEKSVEKAEPLAQGGLFAELSNNLLFS